MDADKLNEAAWEYHKANRYEDNPHRADIMDAFCNGASWLMQQPLADRLTDEEKEKVKKLYLTDEEIDGVKSAFGVYPVAAAVMTKNILEQIFGKELFNEK